MRAANLIAAWRGPAHAWAQVEQILAQQQRLAGCTDEALRTAAQSIRWRLASGEPAESSLVETFALAGEAIWRELGIRLYKVQFFAGIALCRSVIAEMQTGEGKTLTAVGPTCLRALAGCGCHVMTANEYLAGRDAAKLAPVYRRLGLTVGNVHADLDPDQRRAAYDADLTYGTANEFGFDYLRDRLVLMGRTDPCEVPAPGRKRASGTVQRGRFCALIDEADSILLDDGRTPLIIAVPGRPNHVAEPLLKWARAFADRLRPEEHFRFDARKRSAHLTEAGCRAVALAPRPETTRGVDLEEAYLRVEAALKARHAFARDRDYHVLNDEVQIVDESTGRTLEGRKWQFGLHQAIEVQEGLAPTDEDAVAAKIPLQRYLALYTHLSGMTGTASTAAGEFRRLYRLRVWTVPTHRACLRRGLPARVFRTFEAKLLAIVASIQTARSGGRAVLVGTPSIRTSERLSAQLTAAGVPHRLLNARQNAEEAAVVAQAGHAGQVTIATNMAGRGTDIELDEPVRQAGGLHVIATEVHSSRRIDRQLVGRAARQGDPGSYEFLVSLEDELFDHVPLLQRERWHRRASRAATAELSATQWFPVFQRVQRRLERQHARERRQLQHAERRRWTDVSQLGLDPCLDLIEER